MTLIILVEVTFRPCAIRRDVLPFVDNQGVSPEHQIRIMSTVLHTITRA